MQKPNFYVYFYIPDEMKTQQIYFGKKKKALK